MLDYRPPVADMLFTLDHAAGAARLPGWDHELAAQVLDEAGRLVAAEISPLDPIGDRTVLSIADGRVRMPEPFRAAYARYAEGGWQGAAAPQSCGGQELPHVLASAVSEMLSGACMAFQMLASLGPAALRTILNHGDEDQRARYLPKLASGEWLATMCLTEPEAGSDLSQIRCRATPAEDGTFRLNGGKIFISGGDHDLADNIVHLVLAREDGAPDGVKGLSLFAAPAILPDGGRNQIACLRLEEKMGLHASPTCQMGFDGAWAERLGGRGEGLARMFTMMNFQRLEVAGQGVGLTETAAQRSWAYAAQRRQGRAGRDGPGPDPIAAHGDVRRMLLIQAAYAYGLRGLLYRTAVEMELGADPALVEFLTPVCKAFATDCAIEAANLAIQVHGGYGYLREYRVEQLVRDSRIAAIYEGTNGIQGMTLAGRLLRLDGGAGPKAFAAEIGQARDQARPAMAKALDAALGHWEDATRIVAQLPDPSMVAAGYLWLTGLTACGAALARLDAAADRAPNPARVEAAAGFFAACLLPETASLAQRITDWGRAPLSLASTTFMDI